MAHIQGAKEVSAESQSSYKIVDDRGLIDKTSITWTISAIVKGKLYKKIDQSEAPVIKFHNKNTYNLDVHIQVNYKLNDGKSYSLQKEIVLLGKNKEDEPEKQQKEATPDTGNKSVVVNVPDNRPQDDGKEGEITLKIHVYFDGTFANKNNIKAMRDILEQKIGKRPDIHDTEKIERDFDEIFSSEDFEEEKQEILKSKKEEELTLEDKYKVVNEKYEEEVEKVKDDVIAELDQLSTKEKAKDVLDSKTSTGILGKTIGHALGPDPTSGMNSYAQVYTNIPVIYDMEDIETEEEENANEKILKVYVEGVGTRDGGGDDFIALAVGSDSGRMGIPSKVARAFEEILKEADKQKVDADTITAVEVSAIGFSRGAATTRNFVNERTTLLKTLRKINKHITDDMIAYKFVGVFDTVCSVTDFNQMPRIRPDTVSHSKLDTYITSLQKNNIKDYKLAMKGNVEEVVHLVAADEHRLFFPLTTITTSLDAGCGFELVLPGCHCDLGGGDFDIQQEEFTEIVLKHEKQSVGSTLWEHISGNWIKKRITDLVVGEKEAIAEYLMENQWYPATQPVTIYERMKVPVYINQGPFQGSTTRWLEVPMGKQYTLKREVTVGYNRIPLSIMLHFAGKLGKIKLKAKDDADRTKVHDELVPLQNRLLNYAKENHKHGRDATPVKIFNKEFAHLRRKYLHLSAVLDFVQDISDNLTENIAEIKDVARLDIYGHPKRAIFSDRGMSEEIGVWWNIAKRAGQKAWNAMKKKW